MNILLVGSTAITPSQIEKQILANSLNAEVITCSTREMALLIAAKCSIDMVIAHQSHDYKGSELLHQIKLNNPNTYTILISEAGEQPIIGDRNFLDEYIQLPQISTIIRRVQRVTVSFHQIHGQAPIPRYQKDISPLQESGGFLRTRPDTSAFQLFPSEQRLSRLERHKNRHQRKGPQIKEQILSLRQTHEGTREKDPVGFSFARLMGNIAFGFLILIMGVVAFLMVQSNILGKPPSLVGYQMYVVVSGSMEPAIETGSLVLAKSVEPGQVTVGDIITFQGASSNSMLTTHRVVGIDNEEGLSFTTRGDANNVNDPNPVPAGRIVGRVRSSVPYLGYVLGFAQTKQGLVFLIFIPGLLIILYELRNIFKYIVDEKRADAQGEAAQNS